MNESLDYQKVIFKSIICMNKQCRKRRIYIEKEEQLKINEIDGGFYTYQCDCGNNIKFKY
ncbi:hypothetical protein ACSXEK_16365 (plasmid) [Clostridium perfringens]